jgi:hypothetical protein
VPLNARFNLGTFNPSTWVATVILATLANALIEGLVLRLLFKVAFTKRMFCVLAAANLASVGMSSGSLLVSPFHG